MNGCQLLSDKGKGGGNELELTLLMSSKISLKNRSSSSRTTLPLQDDKTMHVSSACILK